MPLRRWSSPYLRRAWAALFGSERAIDIRLVDGTAVRIEVEAADIEDKCEAFRLNARVHAGADVGMEDVAAFAKGGNDIVLFREVTTRARVHRTIDDTCVCRMSVAGPQTTVTTVAAKAVTSPPRRISKYDPLIGNSMYEMLSMA